MGDGGRPQTTKLAMEYSTKTLVSQNVVSFLFFFLPPLSEDFRVYIGHKGESAWVLLWRCVGATQGCFSSASVSQLFPILFPCHPISFCQSFHVVPRAPLNKQSRHQDLGINSSPIVYTQNINKQNPKDLVFCLVSSTTILNIYRILNLCSNTKLSCFEPRWWKIDISYT